MNEIERETQFILKKYNIQSAESNSIAEINASKNYSKEFMVKKNQFYSQINSDSNSFALFSVPYDRFWQAVVNGQNVHVLNVNGLMAVPLNKGLNTIDFSYKYLPFYAGCICSFLGIAASGIYYFIFLSRARGKYK